VGTPARLNQLSDPSAPFTPLASPVSPPRRSLLSLRPLLSPPAAPPTPAGPATPEGPGAGPAEAEARRAHVFTVPYAVEDVQLGIEVAAVHRGSSVPVPAVVNV
jgi:hypothetical protein